MYVLFVCLFCFLLPEKQVSQQASKSFGLDYSPTESHPTHACMHALDDEEFDFLTK